MVSRHNRTVKKHRVAVLGNLARTRSGRVAGNVNYWVPNEGGTTYLYLVDGCVAITAKAMRLVRKGL